MVAIVSLDILEEKVSCPNWDSNRRLPNPLPSHCSAFIFVHTCSMCEPFSYIFFVNCIFLSIQRMLLVILIMQIDVVEF